MMRLPSFRYVAPTTVAEAARILAGEGEGAMILAGGTDLLPNMKRRQQTPSTLVALRRIEELRTAANGAGLVLGAGLTLAAVAASSAVRESYPALRQAAAQVATAHLRNLGTLGGNLCLDTRCHYYDQTEEWRRAIDFCMKKDGAVCWVAPSSKRCLAVSSSDTAPALAALGARVHLVSTQGERTIPLADLYANDGIRHLTRRPDEVLTEVLLPEATGWRSAYWKLRRRGAFDFPVLGVAAAARVGGDGTVEEARIVLGAVASMPLVTDAGKLLVGGRLDDDAIAAAGEAAARIAKPVDNADFSLSWRKKVVAAFVAHALRELRGDDVRAARERIARQALDGVGS
jgi:4-hydroxybenzoyl-CoA reductase subunit beta